MAGLPSLQSIAGEAAARKPGLMSQKRVALATVKVSASASAKKSNFDAALTEGSASSALPEQFSSVSLASQTSVAPGLIPIAPSLQSVAFEE